MEQHTLVLLRTSQESVKCLFATRQLLLAPFICVRRLSQNLLLLEAKSLVTQPVLIHSQMFLTYTDMVHSTRVVLPHLSLHKEQSFLIPAFILPCKPSFFCLLPAQAVHASSNTSGPLLNHYNLTSFTLKDINQA